MASANAVRFDEHPKLLARLDQVDVLIHRRWGARDAASQARQIGLPLS